MSILLDALKRSESQRELGNVPTLKTSIESSAEMLRPVPGWLPGLMSLATAGLISWMGLAQFSLPEDWADPRLAAEAGVTTSGQAESQATEGATVQPARAGKSILPQMPESTPTDQAQTKQAEAQPAQRRLGREVRDYAAQQSPDAAATQPAEPRHDNAVRQTELARVDLARQEQGAPGSVKTPQSGPALSQQPYEPEIINYWQVPEKMRDGLPELHISVLVYAELPENRFVLMNGERLREGQELPNGLVLEEIRRDRAIFNYRNYRFYLKS